MRFPINRKNSNNPVDPKPLNQSNMGKSSNQLIPKPGAGIKKPMTRSSNHLIRKAGNRVC